MELRPGERRERAAIRIAADGRLVSSPGDLLGRRIDAFRARSPDEHVVVSVDEVAVAGERADLSDTRFGARSGRLGYFDVYTFAWNVGPGISFLEPYDEDKVPVLFIHGATGHASEFATLPPE